MDIVENVIGNNKQSYRDSHFLFTSKLFIQNILVSERAYFFFILIAVVVPRYSMWLTTGEIFFK